jgi:hypothetical protein
VIFQRLRRQQLSATNKNICLWTRISLTKLHVWTTMSQHSALMGHAPNTQSDAWIRRAMIIIAPSQLNPNTSQPFGPPRPEGYKFETRGLSLGIGEGFCMFFILLFTIARLWTRYFRTKMFGLDDWMIIPGAVRSSPFFIVEISS